MCHIEICKNQPQFYRLDLHMCFLVFSYTFHINSNFPIHIKRRFIVRYCKVSNLREWILQCSYHLEIWQACFRVVLFWKKIPEFSWLLCGRRHFVSRVTVRNRTMACNFFLRPSKCFNEGSNASMRSIWGQSLLNVFQLTMMFHKWAILSAWVCYLTQLRVFSDALWILCTVCIEYSPIWII